MTGTVSVGCKMPNGLHLDLHVINRNEKGDILSAERERFATLRGCAVAFGQAPHTIGGYAFTDVDADMWAKWLEQNAGSSLLKDKLIIHQPKLASVQAEAKEKAEIPQQSAPLREKDVKKLGVEVLDQKAA